MATSTTGAETVGFYGLGDIGLPMAGRLLERGVALTVGNRTPSKAEPLLRAGAILAGSVRDMVECCTVVFTCLHGPAADREVYLGDGGLLDGDVAGRLFVNTSTIGPELAIELGEAVTRLGAMYVDCPLLGAGRVAAAKGELLLPVGGTPEAIERARPLLELTAAAIEHVGAVGAAQVVKLAFNFQFGVAAAALAQAVRFAMQGGAQAGALEHIMRSASLQSQPTPLYIRRMVDRDHEERGTLRTLAKDVDVAVAFAATVGERATLGEAAAAMYHRAIAQGLDVLDVPALVHVDMGADVPS